ncbi:hypothetical protein BC1002_5372 [Paraburkholderia atlantica]|uniref:Uncharacterized protein n=1 Tax=Paraburkholderia atlantica TaxID=2654982 RepID=D5WFF2_PARAM|nr:hypothetical protein BC1002_5372 [Paraburkholderia atlantica]
MVADPHCQYSGWKGCKHVGTLGDFVPLDNPVFSEWAPETFGWLPPSLERNDEPAINE